MSSICSPVGSTCPSELLLSQWAPLAHQWVPLVPSEPHLSQWAPLVPSEPHFSQWVPLVPSEPHLSPVSSTCRSEFHLFSSEFYLSPVSSTCTSEFHLWPVSLTCCRWVPFVANEFLMNIKGETETRKKKDELLDSQSPSLTFWNQVWESSLVTGFFTSPGVMMSLKPEFFAKFQI